MRWAATVCWLGMLASACAPQSSSTSLAIADRYLADQRKVKAECEALLRSPPPEVNVAALYNRLRAANTAKGEFETTAAYEQRMAGVKAQIEAQNGTLIAATQRISPYRVIYDADTRKVTINGERNSGLVELIRGRAKFSLPRQELETLILFPTATIERSRDTYRASNAFGASTMVSRSTADLWGLGFAEIHGTRPPWQVPAVSLREPVEAEAARGLKDNLAILMIGEIAAPYAWEGSDGHTATFSTPIDRTVDQRVVVVRPKCVALIDRRTRAVFEQLR